MRVVNVAAGLSNLDRATTSALVSGMGLKALAEKYADRIGLYATALAVVDGRVLVPGASPVAESAWTRLMGVNPGNPSAFLRALFEKDGGRLLSYYFVLSQLDLPHQQFFTLTATRLSGYYELFRESPEIQVSGAKALRQSSFAEFLREVPLEDGSVGFPGSPEIWMVVKGRSNSLASTAKLLKKARKKAAPDVEDEILLRLARMRYTGDHERHSELDNFLAVVRVEAHRDEPLDDASALTLAQHYGEYGNVYPYFAIFTGLRHRDYEQFFAVAEKFRSIKILEADLVLGLFRSTLEILSLAVQSGAKPKAEHGHVSAAL